MGFKKLSPVMLAGLALAAYFLFFRKNGAANGNGAALPGPAAPMASPASSTSDILADLAVKTGGLAVKTGGELLQRGGSWAKEKMAMDGMAPASLQGHMASLGAYGELGGSFYGGY